MPTVIINQSRGDAIICDQTEMATNLFTRMRGLLGRASLPQSHGMFFRGESSIHSAFMRFEFDAVFMDKDMKVVGLSEHIPPWKVRGAKGARNILELAAGEISRTGVEIGDQLAVVDR